MEGVSAIVYRGIRGYWRRKGYERLTSAAGRKRKMRVVAMRRRRFWKIRLTSRLKLKLSLSPKKLFLGLRDAYVNVMMRIASTRMIGSGFSGDGVSGLGGRPIKDYDERIVEIYKSIVAAQGQLIRGDGAWICSEIAYPRFKKPYLLVNP